MPSAKCATPWRRRPTCAKRTWRNVLFEFLEAERQLMAARLDAIDAERNRRSAIVDLYLALGA